MNIGQCTLNMVDSYEAVNLSDEFGSFCDKKFKKIKCTWFKLIMWIVQTG